MNDKINIKSIEALPVRYQPFYPTALTEHFRKLPNGELWYEVHYVKKSGTGLCWSDRVKDQEQLNQMMKVKTMKEAVNQ